MKILEERILREGKVFPGEVLKVDCFLNHQIDPVLIGQLADEYYRLFKDENVTKVLTIEASGIAIEKGFQCGASETPCFEKYDNFVPGELLRLAYRDDKLRGDEIAGAL